MAMKAKTMLKNSKKNKSNRKWSAHADLTPGRSRQIEPDYRYEPIHPSNEPKNYDRREYDGYEKVLNEDI